MEKKLTSLKDKYPEDHPIFKIHKYSEAQNVFSRFSRGLLSYVTVAVISIPTEKGRIAWALVLNIFTNHLENYLFYLKKGYSFLVAEIFSFVCYFLFFLPYALYRRVFSHGTHIDLLNTDRNNSEYQS